MLRFAANLNMLFAEHPFLERFGCARAAGFSRVEFHCPYPYDEELEAVAERLARYDLELVLFNLPVSDWRQGGRGNVSHPTRRNEFRAGAAQAAAWATRLGCRQLNCPSGYVEPRFSPTEQHQVMMENLRETAATFAREGKTLLLEPLNPVTHPGFCLTGTRAAAALIDEVGAPNIKIQYDVYQMQRSEGDLANTLRQYLAYIAHVQIADSPGRHQPGTGEINFAFLLRFLEELGYAGVVTLEYMPDGPTEASLAWITEYGYSLAA